MLHFCPQRGCSGTFQLDETAVGTIVKCRKCGAVLSVKTGGLSLVTGSLVEPIDEDQADPNPPAPLAPIAHKETSPMSQHTGEDTGNIVPVILFGVGAVIVIVFLFLPLTDWARMVGKQAEIDQGDASEKRKDGRPPNRQGVKQDGDKAVEKAEKNRSDDDDKWAKKRQQLQEEATDARYAAQRKQSFYTWGMLVGFLFLAVASLLFLGPGQSRAKRVIGGIVITTQMLLVFFSFLLRSSILSTLSAVR
jgi:hypothetical protein